MHFFFFNDPATTEIYTLSLHDALPISRQERRLYALLDCVGAVSVVPRPRDDHGRRGTHHDSVLGVGSRHEQDRKSTRLNSSHANISYAVFCLKKKIQTSHSIP